MMTGSEEYARIHPEVDWNRVSEYTPTTDEMRAFYTAERLDGPHLAGVPEPTAEQAEAEFDRWLSTVGRDVLSRLPDLHARYHCQPGNLLGRKDCSWEGCEFWDAAEFALTAKEQ